VRPCDSPPEERGCARAARTQPATAVQETCVGSSAENCARRPQQTPRPTRRAGAVKHYHTRCASAAHMSSLSPSEGSCWSAWLPRHGRASLHHARPVLVSPGPGTAGGHAPGVCPGVVQEAVVQRSRGRRDGKRLRLRASSLRPLPAVLLGKEVPSSGEGSRPAPSGCAKATRACIGKACDHVTASRQVMWSSAAWREAAIMCVGKLSMRTVSQQTH
jgi:hypothetical protein